MTKTKHKILSVFLSLCMVVSCMVGFSLTAGAECYPTTTGNTSNITYSADGSSVTSVVVNFSYVDSGNFASNPGTRYYNLIFTTNQAKTSMASEWKSNWKWAELAASIDSEAIYSNSDSAASNVVYTKVSNAEAKTLTNANVLYDQGYNTKITGTYTVSDSSILNQFQDGVTYYGLLCSRISGGAWYTGV